MGRAYSLDLRSRVVALIESGVSRHKAAAHFAVSVATAIRWAQRKRDTGALRRRRQAGAGRCHCRRIAPGYWVGSMRSRT